MRNFFADESGDQNPSHEFGEFRFDAEKRVLWRNGDLVFLPPKSADLLSVLLERRGEILERGDLIDRVWKDTFVEEGNLSYTISRLRKALGVNANGEDFIQTIPRRGYRFVDEARVEREVIYEKHSLTETVVEEIHTSNPQPGVTAHRWTRRSPVLIGGIVLAVLGLAAIVALRFGASVTLKSGEINSLAVLPFRSVDGGEHRGLGLADVLITRLSSVRDLVVRPTSAVSDLENREMDLQEAGKRLNVDAVLEGMVHVAADRVRVTARLTRVSDGSSLWSGVFDRPLEEESVIENDIVGQLVNALSLNRELGAYGKAGPFTTNSDAYQLYVRGRYEWNKRSPEGIAEAQRLFRNAIAADPNFALAYIGLADSIVFGAETPELDNAIGKALSLDPDLGEAYATLGFVDTVHRWRWPEAEENFKRAIALRPGYATAHHWYAILLGIQGRNEEAKGEMLKALEINPQSYNFIGDLGQIYYFERDFAKAREYCERAIEIYPNFRFGHSNLEAVYWLEGDYERALGEMLIAVSIGMYPASDDRARETFRTSMLDHYHQPFQNGGGIKELIEFDLKFNAANSMVTRNPNTTYRSAWFYALSGQNEKALDNLEKALEQRAFLMAWVRADPVFDGLRNEPRYQEILRKMGFG